jgi:hypothetical protein
MCVPVMATARRKHQRDAEPGHDHPAAEAIVLTLSSHTLDEN